MTDWITRDSVNRKLARRILPLSALLLLLVWTPPAGAGLITVTPVPESIPDDLEFGQVLRDIRVEGNDYTRESVIRMALRSEIGHPFTQDNARLDVLWVLRLGAFTSVKLATEPVDDGIALIVIVTEASPYVPSLSIALTQENGLEIGPAISSPNLLGWASRLSAYARFGGATNFGIKYSDPLLPGRSFLYGYSWSYFHRQRTNELLEFEETTDEFFFEFLQAVGDEARTGVRFRHIALKSDQDGITLGADNYDHVPALSLFVQNDSRNAVYPTDGFFLEIEGGKWGVFGGDADFWRVDLDVRRYMDAPFLSERHSFAMSSFASLVSGVPGETIPRFQEFFVGGTNSVRGWSLGSRNGQNQWLNTVEYWFRLMKQRRWNMWFLRWRMGLQVGAFGDFGTAWTEPDRLQSNMIGGGGLGLRLTMPVITMIRFDLAMGEDDLGIRIFIGGNEKFVAQRERVR